MADITMTERELLREAHELMATILLAGSMHSDIDPTGPVGRRILAFNSTLRARSILPHEKAA